MATVGELWAALDKIAPPHLAFPDDPIGLQCGRKSDPVAVCLVSLDITPRALKAAKDVGAQAILSHHAAIFTPLSSLAGDSMQVQAVRFAITNGIALLAAHTNWDAAHGGVNDTLAAKLNLLDVSGFSSDIRAQDFKLATYVPEAELDTVIDALSCAGAGEIGLYRRCAFHSLGTGTFEPQAGASPACGSVGKRETVKEHRLEMRVPGFAREAVTEALRQAHPYEEPAFDIWAVANSEAYSLPRAGTLPNPLRFADLRGPVDAALGSRSRLYGDPEAMVKRVAVVGGSGGRYWLQAKAAGCQALVTGEVRHHEGLEASESGMCIVEAGHYHTEQPSMEELRKRLEAELSSVTFRLYEPPGGRCGRHD